jgi:hypothetical protein
MIGFCKLQHVEFRTIHHLGGYKLALESGA